MRQQPSTNLFFHNRRLPTTISHVPDLSSRRTRWCGRLWWSRDATIVTNISFVPSGLNNVHKIQARP
ncbi:hypothetical protein P8452_28115 [Trifolium repens]|nr:hypothetical protein P8452_28115 [Trifolium repens]